LTLSGPGIREYLISDGNAAGSDAVDPILIEATTNTVVRSFIDLPGNGRLTHSVNVGSPEGVHYTYDLDKGMVSQVWRGGFLDATPMWHERGDGSSKPTGSVLHFGAPIFSLAKLSSAKDAWIKDSIGTAFHSKGYRVDDEDRPGFRYIIYGVSVSDELRALENGQGLHRMITLQNPSSNMFLKVAQGKTLQDLGGGLFILDNKSFYIRMDTGSPAPIIREANGAKELVFPVQSKIGYTILF
jgi:hypothetical protein